MDKLKPCPFCGSDPHMWYEYDIERVTCSNDMCLVAERYEGVGRGEWNTRHIDPATKAEIETAVLRRVANKLEGVSVSILYREADAIEGGEV